MEGLKVGDRVRLTKVPPHQGIVLVDEQGVVVEITEEGYTVEFESAVNGTMRGIQEEYLVRAS
jgi:hypothetical protein